jgi:hypothetical protein
LNRITQEAIAEAERFMAAAKKIPPGTNCGPCRYRAQAKRASLDLTRKLAEFRTRACETDVVEKEKSK